MTPSNPPCLDSASKAKASPVPEIFIKTNSITTNRFDPKFNNKDIIYSRLAKEMGPLFVGPMAPHEFLVSYLNTSHDFDNLSLTFNVEEFSFLKEDSPETTMYDKFVSVQPAFF
jgi:hypothetical protein